MKAIALFAAAGLAVSAHADIIGAQNFNALSDAGVPSFDQLPNGGTLTNTGSFNAGGPGLDFSTLWFDTRADTNTGPVAPSAGGDTSDFIGVQSFTGSNAPNVAPDGSPVASGVEHNYEFNDGDGRVELWFETLNTSSYDNRTLALNFWIPPSGYEADDFMKIVLEDGTNSYVLLDYADPNIDNNTSADDGTANWKTLAVNIDSLGAGANLTLKVMFDTNSSSENLFIDNVTFEGRLIPTPGAGALLGLAGLAAARRRRA